MLSTINKKHAAELEVYFNQIKINIIGYNTFFESTDGQKELIYADWIASGRLYRPIEDAMKNSIGPMIANTHSFSSETGKASTYAYKHARYIIKNHVNATENDVLITSGTGMTGVLSRLQRIMGLRVSNNHKTKNYIPENERPVVFITHMEHHSNQVPWMETIADVVIVPGDENNLVSPGNLIQIIKKYANRPIKIGAFTACSNVTGMITPYQELAKIMHAHRGYCIMDFAASAPYVSINMHPLDPEERLDAVLFSPHKFLGGPGSCGVLVFNKELYKAPCPDVPGGGNVKWTTPNGNFGYHDDIETREDAGTPGFLQTMRAAMAIRLKEKMGVDNMHQREKELLDLCFDRLSQVDGLFILGNIDEDRIGCISFGVKNIHYNLIVRLLNDKFGIQVRGGWSCASTYAHYLFKLGDEDSERIIDGIENKRLNNKPGWVRLSLHPVMTNKEALFICDAIDQVTQNIVEWSKHYKYNPRNNEFEHIQISDEKLIEQVHNWFIV